LLFIFLFIFLFILPFFGFWKTHWVILGFLRLLRPAALFAVDGVLPRPGVVGGVFPVDLRAHDGEQNALAARQRRPGHRAVPGVFDHRHHQPTDLRVRQRLHLFDKVIGQHDVALRHKNHPLY